MAKYETDRRGIISKNKNKEKDSHADYTGTCEIDGNEFYIDGWVKDRSDGSGSFLSLRFKDKSSKAASGAGKANGKEEAEDFF